MGAKINMTLAAAISAFALFISFGSLLISWLAFRRTVQKEEPLITASVRRVNDQPGWYYVEITMRSRTNHGYICQELRLRRPKNAVGIPRKLGQSDRGPNGYETLDPLPIEKATHVVPMRLAVSKAGDESGDRMMRMYGYGDSHTEEFFVHAGEPIAPRGWLLSRGRVLKFSVVGVSNEAIQRRMVMTVSRTLPYENKTAVA